MVWLSKDKGYYVTMECSNGSKSSLYKKFKKSLGYLILLICSLISTNSGKNKDLAKWCENICILLFFYIDLFYVFNFIAILEFINETKANLFLLWK